MAFVTGHELVHIAVGHWLGVGGHFTSLTSTDADQNRAGATAVALAWVAGSAPLFTGIVGVGALLAAPWARRRQSNLVATIFGWLAVFGIPYIGVQLMILGGPGRGVDTAAVLVGYFGIARTARGWLVVTGTAFTIAAGFLLDGALGDQQPLSSGVLDTGRRVSVARRIFGRVFIALSLCLIAAGAALFGRSEHRNPVTAFLLADILWAVGMLILTPWQQPGPRFVRDVWLAPAIAAMSLLTLVGIVFPSDYAVAGLFFLPQLATAAYAARNREFGEATTAVSLDRIGIPARVV